eukprot:3830272-Alexandrium_andersonii.AAC.1
MAERPASTKQGKRGCCGRRQWGTTRGHEDHSDCAKGFRDRPTLPGRTRQQNAFFTTWTFGRILSKRTPACALMGAA